jgi:hypothetical protein
MSILLERSTLRRGARIAAAILLLAAVPAAAQDGESSQAIGAGSSTEQPAGRNGAPIAETTSTVVVTPAKPTGAAAVAELRVDSASPGNALLGHRVRVKVLNLAVLAAEGRIKPDSLVLFINGRAIADAVGARVGDSGNELEFKLAYTGPSSQAWLAAFDDIRDGRGELRGPVRVGVGYASGLEAPPARAGAPVMIHFQPYSQLRFYATLCGLVLALGLFGWLVLSSGVLRDSADVSGLPVNQRPFSLGRAQAAAWFFAVFASFLYIRLVTLSYDSLNAEALFLLGLGVATQAGAGLVDTSRRTKARTTLAELGPQVAEMDVQVQEMQAREAQLGASADPAAKMQLSATRASTEVKLEAAQRQIGAANAELKGARSQNFFLDLVSDGEGVSLHRFQMAAWTTVLIGVYLTEVYQNLAMPVLGATMLGLMGLSSTTYVGLKQNERPSTADQPAENSGASSAPAEAMQRTVPTDELRGLEPKPQPEPSTTL